MNSKDDSVAQLSDQDIAAIKEDLHESSLIIKEDIKNDPEYGGEADPIINVIDNLESSLKSVRTHADLSEAEWTRIFTSMSLLHDMLEEIYAEDELSEEEFDEDLDLEEEK